MFRYFVKRIFYQPRNTPDYVIYLETAVSSFFVSTLGLYAVRKVLDMPVDRFPRKVATEIVNRRLFWYKGLRELLMLRITTPYK